MESSGKKRDELWSWQLRCVLWWATLHSRFQRTIKSRVWSCWERSSSNAEIREEGPWSVHLQVDAVAEDLDVHLTVTKKGGRQKPHTAAQSSHEEGGLQSAPEEQSLGSSGSDDLDAQSVHVSQADQSRSAASSGRWLWIKHRTRKEQNLEGIQLPLVHGVWATLQNTQVRIKGLVGYVISSTRMGNSSPCYLEDSAISSGAPTDTSKHCSVLQLNVLRCALLMELARRLPLTIGRIQAVLVVLQPSGGGFHVF